MISVARRTAKAPNKTRESNAENFKAGAFEPGASVAGSPVDDSGVSVGKKRGRPNKAQAPAKSALVLPQQQQGNVTDADPDVTPTAPLSMQGEVANPQRENETSNLPESSSQEKIETGGFAVKESMFGKKERTQ
jgi:hypothetical protein